MLNESLSIFFIIVPLTASAANFGKCNIAYSVTTYTWTKYIKLSIRDSYCLCDRQWNSLWMGKNNSFAAVTLLLIITSHEQPHFAECMKTFWFSPKYDLTLRWHTAKYIGHERSQITVYNELIKRIPDIVGMCACAIRSIAMKFKYLIWDTINVLML